MNATIHHGDCIEVMQSMEDDSIDAIVTDPPYGLGFMGKAWDQLPPGKEWAEECLRVLKPGGHLLAFGGSRTWHRLAVAVEDGGFEIRESIAWMHSQGFPKHRAALKPAFEPIVMGRKPFKGSLAANESIYGTGALDINGCRTGGRWPANVLLSPTQAEALDAQSGISPAKPGRTGKRGGSAWHGMEHFGSPDKEGIWPADPGGGASRFFYVAKPSSRERPVIDGIAHPTVKPLALMRYLIKLVTPEGGTVLDPFAGSGTTLEAATLEGFNSIGIEMEAEYLPLIRARLDRVA